MTVRKNGTDAGTLKTRMGFLIRDQAASWHGRQCGGSRLAPSFRGTQFCANWNLGIPEKIPRITPE
jgi:hypothetical protein